MISGQVEGGEGARSTAASPSPADAGDGERGKACGEGVEGGICVEKILSGSSDVRGRGKDEMENLTGGVKNAPNLQDVQVRAREEERRPKGRSVHYVRVINLLDAIYNVALTLLSSPVSSSWTPADERH